MRSINLTDGMREELRYAARNVLKEKMLKDIKVIFLEIIVDIVNSKDVQEPLKCPYVTKSHMIGFQYLFGGIVNDLIGHNTYDLKTLPDDMFNTGVKKAIPYAMQDVAITGYNTNSVFILKKNNNHLTTIKDYTPGKKDFKQEVLNLKIKYEPEALQLRNLESALYSYTYTKSLITANPYFEKLICKIFDTRAIHAGKLAKEYALRRKERKLAMQQNTTISEKGEMNIKLDENATELANIVSKAVLINSINQQVKN